MSMTQAVFRTIATKVDDPSHIVMGMNTMASRGNTTGMFATLFVGVLDLATGRLSYCNAGHEKPIIITGRNMRYLDVTANIPIGVMEEKIQYPGIGHRCGRYDLALYGWPHRSDERKW